MKFKTHIAILGGAFNPITVGHIETANYVLNSLVDIEEVWITPIYKHAFGKDIVDAKHRVIMSEYAAKDANRHNKIKVFEYEIKNKLQNGTLHFIEHLEDNKYFKDYVFYFIIGMDNANEISKWINWERLIKVGKFIVINRPGIERDLSQDWYLKYPHNYLKKPSNIVEISSTHIRILLSQYYATKEVAILNQLKKYLNPKVLQYILKNKLYLQHEKHPQIL